MASCGLSGQAAGFGLDRPAHVQGPGVPGVFEATYRCEHLFICQQQKKVLGAWSHRTDRSEWPPTRVPKRDRGPGSPK
jgi:hypothetical protein